MTSATVGLVVAVVAGCTAADDPQLGADPNATGDVEPGAPVVLPDDVQLASALMPFDQCDELLDHLQTAALEVVGPWGLDDGMHRLYGGDEMAMMDDSAGAVTTESTADMDMPAADMAPAAGPEATGTNVQEAGVDEPDVVKTDGTHLYIMRGTRLHVLDSTGDAPREVASLDLDEVWGAQLLLIGDQLLVTTSSFDARPFPAIFGGGREGSVGAATDAEPATDGGLMIWPGGTEGTTLTRIDVSDPTNPEPVEQLAVDGRIVSSRLVDGVARVVVQTPAGPDLAWRHPTTSGLRGQERATEANRDVIRDATIEDWLPWSVHTTADGQRTDGPLVACDQVSRPSAFSGLGLLSVLTIDPAAGLADAPASATSVLAAGETVYGSTERLYVATTRWQPPSEDQGSSDDATSSSFPARPGAATTELHAFDLATPRAVYAGSGSVPGTLLSQWAMSEHDGYLRVASTVGDAWSDVEPSESVVTVLELQDDELVEVGQVDGLGLTERIYAVRFLGDVGYVVTFRETDPLYTLDLRDPTEPTVTGELKITGYSAYLHPLGDGLLLGVGQEATEEGMTTGTQLSLFDVSDPAAPTRLDKIDLPGGSSDVEYDHRAFFHWPATGLTVVPYVVWGWGGVMTDDEPGDQRNEPEHDAGAVAVVGSRQDGLSERTRIRHDAEVTSDTASVQSDPQSAMYYDPWFGRIERTLVVGDQLVTISPAGVAHHDLEALTPRGFLPLRGDW